MLPPFSLSANKERQMHKEVKKNNILLKENSNNKENNKNH